MSIPALNWARRQQTGSPTRKAVLMDLADRANSDGECFPGQESIAHDLEMGERTVRRAIQGLEADGFLSVTRRSWPDSKRRRTSRYRLHIEPPARVTGSTEPPARVTSEPPARVTSDESEAVNRKLESPAREKKTPKQTFSARCPHGNIDTIAEVCEQCQSERRENRERALGAGSLLDAVRGKQVSDAKNEAHEERSTT